MKCPWQDFTGGPRALHAHLGERHGDAVITTAHHGKMFYEVTCPSCGARYEHVVRKGSRDPDFVVEFEHEIKMVALDMLINHLLAEHEQQDTGAQPEAGD